MLRRILTTNRPAMLVLPFVSICSEKSEHLRWAGGGGGGWGRTSLWMAQQAAGVLAPLTGSWVWNSRQAWRRAGGHPVHSWPPHAGDA